MTDLISDLQSAIVTLLTVTATDMTGLPVVSSDDLRAPSKLAEALSGTGLCAIVITPDLALSPEERMDATPSIRVIEKVLQNRSAAGSGHAGSWWAYHIASWCWKANVGDIWDPLIVRNVQQVEGTEETLEYMITLTTGCVFRAEDETPVAPPAPEP